MKHSNTTNVSGIERERKGNWKGQESVHKYTACLMWSPAIWKWLWHRCLAKINHISASTQLHFCDVPSLDTLFPCLGHQSKAILGQQAPPLGLYYLNRQLLLKKCQSHNDIQTIFQHFTMRLRRRDVVRLKSSANWPLGTSHTSWGENFNAFLCISCLASPQDKAAVQLSHIPQLWSLGRACPGHLRALPARAGDQLTKLPALSSWYTEELCCHEDTEPTCHFFWPHRKCI